MIVGLKLLSSLAVMECNIPKKKKIEVLKYIKENSNEIELMSFLLDGDFRKTDDLSEQIIRDRFENSYLNEFVGLALKAANLARKSLPVIGSIVAWSVFDSTLFRSWRLLKSNLDKTIKQCGRFRQGLDFERCVIKAKVDNQRQKIQILNKMKSTQCPKNKNPVKCVEKVTKEIEKETLKLNVLNKRLTTIE